MPVPNKLEIGEELNEFPGGSFNALVEGYFPGLLKGDLANGQTKEIHSPHSASPTLQFDVRDPPVDWEPGAPAAVSVVTQAWTDLPADGKTYPGVQFGPDPLIRDDVQALLDINFTAKDSIHSGVIPTINQVGTTIGSRKNGNSGTIVMKGLAWVWCDVKEEFHHRVRPGVESGSDIWLSGHGGHAILWRAAWTTPKEQWVLIDIGGDYGQFSDSFSNYFKVNHIS